MRRDRNMVKDHEDWPLPVVRYLDRVEAGVKTIPLSVMGSNRHKAPLKAFWVFTNDIYLPIDKHYLLWIKKGFVTDFASVPIKPKVLRMLLRHNSLDTRRGSVTHDALFNHKSLGFEYSNKIFKDILLEDGSSYTKAYLMHFGVSTPIGRKHFDTTTQFDVCNKQYSAILNLEVRIG